MKKEPNINAIKDSEAEFLTMFQKIIQRLASSGAALLVENEIAVSHLLAEPHDNKALPQLAHSKNKMLLDALHNFANKLSNEKKGNHPLSWMNNSSQVFEIITKLKQYLNSPSTLTVTQAEIENKIFNLPKGPVRNELQKICTEVFAAPESNVECEQKSDATSTPKPSR